MRRSSVVSSSGVRVRCREHSYQTVFSCKVSFTTVGQDIELCGLKLWPVLFVIVLIHRPLAVDPIELRKLYRNAIALHIEPWSNTDSTSGKT